MLPFVRLRIGSIKLISDLPVLVKEPFTSTVEA